MGVNILIDNYDSFTYNLVQYFGELGERFLVFRNDKITVSEIENKNPPRIVISPGPGVPQKAGITIETIKHFSGKVPILGVCLGHQAIGAAFGGRISQAKRIMHGKVSEIYHDGKYLFENLPNPFIATRYHSLIIDPKSLPDVLEITARSEDGEIMGVRHKEFLLYGVQFHPESILSYAGKELLKNFLNLSR
ncbi:MAG: anthranilate/aminodeoxychorismate synthase component II [Candidatus Schekmanbacteria bacterium GWA2_38_11]|uniref:Anthranilate/aminodeoxychorismate synthase component II n=1 Tax=Candidatus Schekmanbacteria bacterium GWA2_38_11 TaxID=1817876 RepID=A0A1F7RC59_9BACT|nr:MAG: anthranilate/aminodeoxychorismate synthase component II [Candidatus Schekmanbacteria bacterium GWA2_38_11]